jgi:anhydro-N-acetylmuramic acid kinase
MNKDLKKLFEIANKEERIILGLMSGTSLDGLDMALCSFSGSGLSTKVKILKFDTYNYSKEFKEEIKQVFAKPKVNFEFLCLLNEKIGLHHAEIINETLEKWNIDKANVDLIASHGQTVYHAPLIKHQKQGFPNATLQIGDGDHIAVHTGIITISDFRQKHLAGGGEGAPLAVYGDYILFADEEKNRFLLNIGGISNFTYIPALKNKHSRFFSTDTGPGNTLMDQFMQAEFNLYYDKDAEKAQQGNVNKNLLAALLNHPFFDLNTPKSTGPELFNLDYLNNSRFISNTLNISPNDVLATLCEFTAICIAKEINKTSISENTEIILSGGGMHNPLIVKRLKSLTNEITLKDTYIKDILPDAKEALLFALLANETLVGEALDFGLESKVPQVCMGKISLPH